MLEPIRRSVVDAFFAIPRGGLEVGGVLFGRRDGDTVRIEAYREVECEHAAGPGFTLSARDEARLAACLRDSPLQPVGWYRSRTRSPLGIGEADVATHDRHFPAPWQV
ncbi:MAG: hypothetical protein ACRD96_12325, partial [Bryobacteraceae bacterium]